MWRVVAVYVKEAGEKACGVMFCWSDGSEICNGHESKHHVPMLRGIAQTKISPTMITITFEFDRYF